LLSGPRSLEEIASLAVADLRQTCTLRTMKYGVPGSWKSIFTYQAARRNLADAMEIHAEITGKQASGVGFLRQKADDLSLKDPKLIQAVETGEALSALDQKKLDSDVRIAESVASRFVVQAAGQT